MGASTGSVLIGTAMLVAGVFLALGGVFAVLVQDWSGAATTAGLVVVVLVAGVVVTFTWRLIMTGVYVSDGGLRVRTPLRTLSFGWAAVLSVRSQKITRMVSQPVLIVTARQVCLDLVDGQTVELPIHGVVRGGSRPWRMPDVLPETEFERLLAELRHHTAVYQTRKS